MGESLIIRRRDVPNNSFKPQEPGQTTASITSCGVIIFSKRVSAALGDVPLVVAQFDEETRTMTFIGAQEPPRGLEIEDCFRTHQSKSSRNRQGMAVQITLSVGNLLKWLNYDYKAGSHTFDALVNDERHSVSFIVPEGALPPQPRRIQSVQSVQKKGMQRANSSASGVGQ